MTTTDRIFTQNNFQTLSWTLSKSYTQYRIQVCAEISSLYSSEFNRLRMKMLLSVIECHGIVLDCVMSYEASSYKMSVLCCAKAIPSVFSAVIHKMIPSSIIEEIPGNLMARRIESQMESSVEFFSKKNIPAIQTSREILISLLLEYRGLLCISTDDGQDLCSTSHYFSCKDLEVPFLFFLLEKDLIGLPEFMVEKIHKENENLVLNIKKEYGEKSISGIIPQISKKLNIADMKCVQKKRCGYYRTFSNDLQFTLLVPSLIR